MDRCKCWVISQVTIYIEHCPSESQEIVRELDRVTHFTMKETGLNQFGKVRVGTIVTSPAPSDRG